MGTPIFGGTSIALMTMFVVPVLFCIARLVRVHQQRIEKT
jgi:hypothetical protein